MLRKEDFAMSTEPEPRIYQIVRYRRNGGRKLIIHKKVTLAEAQNHCRSPDTKSETWFDGFVYMPGCAPKKDN